MRYLNFDRHFNIYVALFVYLTTLGVLCLFKGGDFAQGMVTGSMLTVSTLLRGDEHRSPDGDDK